MDEDGYFFILDRKKDMILSGGFNVYPQVVEQAIYEHSDVEEVLVIGVADPYRGEAAKAFVKLRSGAPPLTLDALRDFLADKIGRHEMPAALEIRAALPRTNVGKLSKKELIDEERARPSPSPAGGGSDCRRQSGVGVTGGGTTYSVAVENVTHRPSPPPRRARARRPPPCRGRWAAGLPGSP